MSKKNSKTTTTFNRIMICIIIFFCISIIGVCILWKVTNQSGYIRIAEFLIIILFALIIIFIVINIFVQLLNRRLLAKNAEIRSLQNQIDAHFMYNVLESIKMMAEIKEDYEISDAITSLGEMFRYSMQWTSGLVSIEDEIEYTKNYLALINVRHDYEYKIIIDIDEDLMNIKIPKMSIQPIVENAISYGLEEVTNDSEIKVSAKKSKNKVIISVTDFGTGITKEKLEEINYKLKYMDEVDEDQEHGRALVNIKQRLNVYYGHSYDLIIDSKYNEYTKVYFEVPYEKEK